MISEANTLKSVFIQKLPENTPSERCDN